MRNELLLYYYYYYYELFHISQFVLMMLNSKMVSWRLRNVVFLAVIFSSYEFQVVKQTEGVNQGYGKKEMLTHNLERLWLLNAISRLRFEFQDKIGCKIAKELWSLNLYHIFNVNKVTGMKIELNYELWMNEWLLIIINKLFNGLHIM